MASSDGHDVPSFESLEDELRFYRESYRQAILNNKMCCLKNARLNQQKSDEIVAKRARIEQEEVQNHPFKDPLKFLNTDEFYKILRYLKPMELLTVMEVSSGWKNFIEGQNLLNRAMDSILVKPRNISLPLPNQIIDKSLKKRPYKHMEGPFIISISSFAKFMPIQFYAATLETLKIHDVNSEFSGQINGCTFPKLKVLKYEGTRFGVFRDFHFPVVTELSVDIIGSFFNIFKRTLRTTLYKFPALKKFSIEFTGNFLPEPNLQDPQNNLLDPDLPMLEELKTKIYFPNFITQQKNSLQVLTIEMINMKELGWLLRDLKVLKSLTVLKLGPGPEPLYTNHSIKLLKIMGWCQRITQAVETPIHTHHCGYFERIFLAIPKLQELVLWTASDDSIRFAASNLETLKKMTGKVVTEDATEAYREIQANRHRYLNTSFELITDPACFAETDYESDVDIM